MSNRKSLTMIVAGLSTALALTACSKTVDAATFPTASISNVAYSEQEAKQLPSDGTITEAGVYKVSGNHHADYRQRPQGRFRSAAARRGHHKLHGEHQASRGCGAVCGRGLQY